MQNAANQTTPSASKRFDTKTLVLTAMFIALTVVMWNTPIGRITLPFVTVTIAHIPILIATITVGLPAGLAVSLAFGLMSLFIAMTSPASVLDPFFVNPLISILPRVMIPVVTYFVYKGLHRLMGAKKVGDIAATGIAVALGNLTNTFGVYGMLYLIYAKAILEQTGTPAISLIVTSLSTSTALKCVVVVLICTPVIVAIKRALRYSR
jgi:uncharacterized membrane protein